ncbi:MAG: magnesium transporter [Planctomycetia bacterium]|nr:magnesium transporter [Planctomycetia bacterium]
MQTRIYRLAWKRGIWLTVLFFSSMMTAVLLNGYQSAMNPFPWLVMFIPLIVSSGGNSGNQSATLIITALSTKDLDVGHWRRVVVRELLSGLLLGTFLGLNGFVLALLLAPTVMGAAVVGATLLMVIVCGTLAGSMLPLLFRRLGLDPALMSNPLVACLIDIAGIVIYVEVALRVLSTPK